MNQDPVVLSYDESLLRKSDVDLLNGPHWLNDNIISFYFEYLKNTYKSRFLLFIAPEVTQCVKITSKSQLEIFLEPLNLESRDFVFFALNDNDCPQFAGGSHWSLLLYSRPEQTVYHYDSARGSNSSQAESFATKLFSYFNVSGKFKEEVVHQQTNGYDCGIFLICYAELLAHYLYKHGKYRNCGLNDNFIAKTQSMRDHIISIIEQLKS